jgi:hypothetical protein
MLVDFFSDQSRRELFMTTVDTCAPGVAAETLTRFDEWWAHIRVNTYVSSISEHEDSEDEHGRLSMWRAFGGTLARVAIVLRIPKHTGSAERLNLIFSPVAYMNQDQVNYTIFTIVENIKANADFLRTLDRATLGGWLFSTLVAGVTCLKHEGFLEEREWRAIYDPIRASSPLMTRSTEVIGGIPQFIYQIPLDRSFSADVAGLDLASIFDRLIIGPSPYPWVMYEAFTDALTTAGVADANKRVLISGIPIRA